MRKGFPSAHRCSRSCGAQQQQSGSFACPEGEKHISGWLGFAKTDLIATGRVKALNAVRYKRFQCSGAGYKEGDGLAFREREFRSAVLVGQELSFQEGKKPFTTMSLWMLCERDSAASCQTLARLRYGTKQGQVFRAIICRH